MPCCSDPGTWTGTDTPGDMRPARERQTQTLSQAANFQLFITVAGKQSETGEAAEVAVPVLELAEDGVCRCGEEYADESKLRGADGDGGNMHE